MPLVHIKTARLEYRFEINGKYTIIQGDSGTGKTTFYSLVSAMYNEPKSVQNISGELLVPVGIDADESVLKKYEGKILVLDENCTLFKKYNIATLFKDSKNYFIIINRSIETLGYLPIHVDNIFYMKTSGKFHTLVRMYERFEVTELGGLDVIITEDKKSGYLFFEDMLRRYDIKSSNIILEPAYGDKDDRLKDNKAGNSKIVRSIQFHIDNGMKDIFVVYDASAFGAYIDLLRDLINANIGKINIYVLDWNSFEGYILGSKLFNEHYDLEDLDFNSESLEQFMTDRLSEKLEGYSKKCLHKCLCVDRCINCKNATGCKYRLFDYKDLVYDEVKILHDYVDGMYLDFVKGFNAYIIGDKG